MEHLDTRDIAALLAATDDDGHIDPTIYEAQRLILHHRRHGWIDTDALMRSVHRTTHADDERNALVAALDARLDDEEEQARFRQSMGENYLWSELSSGVEHAWTWTRTHAVDADQRFSDVLAHIRRHALSTQDDPHASWATRLRMGAVAFGAGTLQRGYGTFKGGANGAIETVTGLIDAVQLARNLASDPAYRQAVLNVIEAYSHDVQEDIAKPARDAYGAASKALSQWQAGYEEAKAQGRDLEYVGYARGAIGFEIVSAIIPVAKIGKIGKVIDLLAHGPIRHVEDAASVLRQVVHWEREGHVAAKAATEVVHSVYEGARREGRLLDFLEAAKKTDTVNGLLRSGKLSPKELRELYQLDKSIFHDPRTGAVKDGVSFRQALTATQRGLDLTKLSAKQIGDLGEAIHTVDMLERGYTDIIAIKNRSGHGIDFVARNPQGKLEFHEVKTSAVGRPMAQSGDPKKFIEDRLKKALAGMGHWKEKNVPSGLKQTVERLYEEIQEARGNIDAKWVQISLERTPGSPELKVKKTVEDWVKPKEVTHRTSDIPSISPTIAAALPRRIPGDMRDQTHPAYEKFCSALQEVHRLEASLKIAPGPRSDQLAAGLVVAAEYVRTPIGPVHLDNGKAVMVYQSTHPGTKPRMVSVSPVDSLAFTVEQHSAKWLKARSPYYDETLARPRTVEQAHLLSQLSPLNQELFAKIRGQVPAGVSDDMVMQATMVARDVGMHPARIQRVNLMGELLEIKDTQVFFAERIQLSKPMLELDDAVRQAGVMEQQAMENHLNQQRQQRGRGLA